MILVINICKEKLHYLEFVKPIEDILIFQGYRECMTITSPSSQNAFENFQDRSNDFNKSVLLTPPNEDKLINKTEKSRLFFTRHYLQISGKDLERADKVIICGTSLKDNEFVRNIVKFSWIKRFDKPLLGICGGMQIISLVLDNKKLNKKTEIGFYKERFDRNFLGLKGEQEVYHLHNYYCPSFGGEFDIYCKGNGVIQAAKHKSREIYCVLFHPEVRQKDLISNFALL